MVHMYLPISAANSVTLSLFEKGVVPPDEGKASTRLGSLNPSNVLNEDNNSGNFLYRK